MNFWNNICLTVEKDRKMKKTILLTLLIGATTLFFGSCAKTVNPTWMVYEEDNCTPPWVGKNDRRSKDNLEALLRADGVIPLKIKIKGDRSNACVDCDCKTGKSYHVQVDKAQLSWLFYYGFEVE